MTLSASPSISPWFSLFPISQAVLMLIEIQISLHLYRHKPKQMNASMAELVRKKIKTFFVL